MITLYQGNALSVMVQLPHDLITDLFDAIICDPPYASGAATLAGKQDTTAIKYTSSKSRCKLPDFAGDSMDQRTWTHFMTDILRQARCISKPDAVCAIFVDWRQLPSLTDALQMAGWLWRGIAVWDKGNSRPQRGRYRNQAEYIVWGSAGPLPFDRPVPALPGVYRYANVQGAQRIHQTQKPLELMRAVIRLCVPGGRILDPFAGSGSTLAAAMADGYDAVGIEYVPQIAMAAAKRLGVEVIPLG